VTIGQEAALEARKTIDEERKLVLEKNGATFPKLIKELCLIAFSDIRDYVTIDEGGAIQAIPLEYIKKTKSKAIKKVKEHTTIKEAKDGSEVWKDSRIEYELYDKLDALKYLCKLWGDEPAQKIDANTTGTLNIQVVKFAAGDDVPNP
jgi:hypothetical protein